MTVHEFGKENKDAMLLIHPSVVKWDYFEYVIPLLEDRYHLIVPALPGYDFEQPGDFTSVEGIAGGVWDTAAHGSRPPTAAPWAAPSPCGWRLMGGSG